MRVIVVVISLLGSNVDPRRGTGLDELDPSTWPGTLPETCHGTVSKRIQVRRHSGG
jgi:hypothetical protein